MRTLLLLVTLLAVTLCFKRCSFPDTPTFFEKCLFLSQMVKLNKRLCLPCCCGWNLYLVQRKLDKRYKFVKNTKILLKNKRCYKKRPCRWGRSAAVSSAKPLDVMNRNNSFNWRRRKPCKLCTWKDRRKGRKCKCTYEKLDVFRLYKLKKDYYFIARNCYNQVYVVQIEVDFCNHRSIKIKLYNAFLFSQFFPFTYPRQAQEEC